MLRLLRIKLSPPLRFYNKSITTNFPSFSKLSSSSNAATAAAADPSTIAATAAFLEGSCGLSSNAALSASKNHPFKSISNARSVLALLESHGFSQADIARILARNPRILSMKPEKTVKPKLTFLQSAGLLEIFPLSSWLLKRSLDKVLVPNFELLRSILLSNANVLAALKNAPRLILRNSVKIMLPMMDALRSHGVTDPIMLLLLMKYGYVFLKRKRSFEEALAAVKEMGINPTKRVFADALGVLLYLPKELWQLKLETYKSLGWSLEQTLFAFARHPRFMFNSLEKAKKNIMFLEEELKWGPDYLSKNTIILNFSLEKRIIPRYKVLRNLISKGLVKDVFSAKCFTISNDVFQTRYVMKYHDKVPDLVADFAGSKLQAGRSEDVRDEPM